MTKASIHSKYVLRLPRTLFFCVHYVNLLTRRFNSHYFQQMLNPPQPTHHSTEGRPTSCSKGVKKMSRGHCSVQRVGEPSCTMTTREARVILFLITYRERDACKERRAVSVLKRP